MAVYKVQAIMQGHMYPPPPFLRGPHTQYIHDQMFGELAEA